MTQQDSEWITLREASTKFGLSPDSLRVYVFKNKLKAKKRGRDWWTTAKAVAQYLDGRERKRKPK